MELPKAISYIAEHGGVRPYPLVYSEAPEEIDKLIDSGVPVYISGYTLMIHPPARELERRCNLVCVGQTEAFAFFRLLRK